jgi:hypothetical protein
MGGNRSSTYVASEIDKISKYQLKRKRDINLQKLEQQENAGGDSKNNSENKKDNSDAEVRIISIRLYFDKTCIQDDELNAENDEFELDDDYGVDHYASGDEGGYDSGGEAEAFF